MNRQQALLLKIMEECDELSQRCSKAIRFTLEEKQDGQDLTNAERIREEYIDLKAAILVLEREMGWSMNMENFSHEEIRVRERRIEKYIDYSKTLGTIKD